MITPQTTAVRNPHILPLCQRINYITEVQICFDLLQPLRCYIYLCPAQNKTQNSFYFSLLF